MRFTLSSTALSSKLTALSRVINSKNPTAILGDFMFKTDNGTLYITASDGENTLCSSIMLTDCDANGSFAIDNHNILEAVRGFSEQPITFDVNMTENIVNVAYLNGHFTLPVESADSYPIPASLSDSVQVFTIKSELLLETISRSIFATANEELRPVMNGLYFDFVDGNLTVVASDGHKLVRNKLYNINAQSISSFNLAKKPANLLKNMLMKDDSDVTITYDGRIAKVEFGDTIMMCRLVEGRYPNYNSVIPKNNSNVVTVDREAMLNAIKRVSPFANDSSNLIRIHVENSVMQLDAEDNDFNKTAMERLACDYNDMAMSIGFKASACTEILSNIDSQEVRIELSDPSRAGLIVPVEQPNDQEVLMLIMPMLINN